ncbi:hypothetical protein [uncultured Thermanaerothrix sp.]|uniref:hypothetical protein n=1 Tax=uncultured Thermanaerothrix sp. TaxID=1195149 RepID=UPI00260C99F9|nr:hypothetical protein [uncultured Thermanaerothrix sp.]
MEKRTLRLRLILEILIVVVLCLLTLWVFYSLGVFNPPQSERRATLLIKASGGFAHIDYRVGNTMIYKQHAVATPWKLETTFSQGEEVFLTAANPSGYGDLECQIILNGRVWKSQRAEFPDDKVACAGIVP